MERKTIDSHDVIEMFGVADPLQWRILEEDEDKMLLLCETCIALCSFNLSNADSSWKNSSTREHLNDYHIIDLCFSTFDEEEVVLANPETGDQFFLLSMEQLVKYFPREHDGDEGCLVRRCKFVPWWLHLSMKLGTNEFVDVVDANGTTCSPKAP